MFSQTRRSVIASLLWMSGLIWAASPVWAEDEATPTDEPAAEQTESAIPASTSDHRKFKQLKGPFTSGPEVTKACLECHTEAAKQIHSSKHWKWSFKNPNTGQELGKNVVLNNFCGTIQSNEPRCTSCHIGYGWKDNTFDFTVEENVDCLVCHDTTGAYKKNPTGAGHPFYKEVKKGDKVIPPPDLAKVAQNVGKTSRQTCGNCHFFGGGGNAVKHGDLDASLFKPGKYLDVHMSPAKLNFSCSTCHKSDKHEVAGSRYNVQASDTKPVSVPGRDEPGRATCQSCHSNTPHKDSKINEHTDKLACQSCHIPEFARGGYATKMWWDWSTAGKLNPDGSPVVIKNKEGEDVYHAKKGDFIWEHNVVPEYEWFNGTVNYTLLGDKIEPGKVVLLNKFEGSPDDPKSRIWPVKVMRGKQVYDAGNNTLAVLHTFGKDKTAYWKGYDFASAVEAGMKYIDAPYSGEYGFVETEMRWPITHMVAPKDDTVACAQCHARDGRMKNVPGVYIPGRDYNRLVDTVGWALVLLTIIAVLIHAVVRIGFEMKQK